jgi:hypothetical protein
VLEFAIFFINCYSGSSETLSKDKNILDQEKVMKKLKIFFKNYHTKLIFFYRIIPFKKYLKKQHIFILLYFIIAIFKRVVYIKCNNLTCNLIVNHLDQPVNWLI